MWVAEIFWGLVGIGILLIVQIVIFAYGYGKLWQKVKDQNGDIAEIKEAVKGIVASYIDLCERVTRVEERKNK